MVISITTIHVLKRFIAEILRQTNNAKYSLFSIKQSKRSLDEGAGRSLYAQKFLAVLLN